MLENREDLKTLLRGSDSEGEPSPKEGILGGVEGHS